MTKLVFLAFLSMAVAIGEAATITVGGTTGWTIPPNTDFYNTWENTQNINVGDTLVFNFAQGAHSVAGVTEADYASCNVDSPIFTQTTSPFSFVINETSNYYFICTFANHCSRGQKLAITNVKPSSPSSSTFPPPSNTNGPPSSSTPYFSLPPPSTTNGPSSSVTPPPPPPPPNAAHSLASAFSLVIVAVAVVLGLVRV